MSVNASALLAPLHQQCNTLPNGHTRWFFDWPQLSEEQWEKIAVTCLEELCDAGADPCPSGLVWKGLVLTPIAVDATDAPSQDAKDFPPISDVTNVYFAVFSEPNWEMETTTLCYTPAYGIALDRDEIDMVIGEEIAVLAANTNS